MLFNNLTNIITKTKQISLCKYNDYVLKKKYNFVELFKDNKHSILYKTNNNYIVKKTPLSTINNENDILKYLDNKDIIKIINSYNDLHNNYIVMDYYEKGDLYDSIYNNKIIFNNKLMNEDFLIKLINPILYIHKMNVVHLDLKLENYLIGNNNNFILCDFHLSKYHPESYNTKYNIDYIAGTKYFIAPEIYEGYYTKKTDIYSLGCILYLLYTKTHYRNDIKYDLLQNAPNSVINLLNDTLKINPNERPTIIDIKNSYF